MNNLATEVWGVILVGYATGIDHWNPHWNFQYTNALEGPSLVLIHQKFSQYLSKIYACFCPAKDLKQAESKYWAW